ncbi:uncharacterized protein ARMOST_14115 [Armillaria ostoyae]|uniref:Uncharacterized protein n=1 Tax=Armillaria ostoyae TaxID=47428 RepID=A0A284RPN6_ARMOS|nr:uncharacterized protein ARMOST_14115 [Armillaria ostoyae]
MKCISNNMNMCLQDWCSPALDISIILTPLKFFLPSKISRPGRFMAFHNFVKHVAKHQTLMPVPHQRERLEARGARSHTGY